MPTSAIDHLAFTSPTLALGVEFVADLLGAAPRPGGRHPRMGTHNALLRLGPAVYLEVIAVDPDAGPHDLPQVFGLGRGRTRPLLANWVARTPDVRAAAAADPAYRRIEPMSRGSLRWEITLPEGDGLIFDGLAPLLIQWLAEPHPAAAMPDSGCALEGLEGWHPRAEALSGLLRALGLQDAMAIHPGPAPRLVAHLRTPRGLRALTSGAPDA